MPGSRAHWTFWADRRAVWRSPRPCNVLNLLIPAIWLAALHLLLRPRLRALHLALHLAMRLVWRLPLLASPLLLLRLRPHKHRPMQASLLVRLLSPPLVCPPCAVLRPLLLVLLPRLLRLQSLRLRLHRLKQRLCPRLAKLRLGSTSSSLLLPKNAGSIPVLIKPIPASFRCARATPLPLRSPRVWN